VTKHFLAAILAAVVILAPSSFAQPEEGFRVPCEDPVAGEYIVGLHDHSYRAPGASFSAAPTIPEIAREVANVHGGEVFSVLDRTVGGFVLHVADSRARGLLRDPRVRFIEQSCPLTPSAVQSSPGWALDRVDEVYRPTDNAYEYRETGSGSHVYVLDSGIEPHSEFGSRLLNGTDLTGGSTYGKVDGCGHGSAVASNAVGATYGVAKGAYVHPVRMANTYCSASTAYATSGINWIISNHVKPAVINISWYFSPSGVSAMESAISSALSNGIIVVVSANNLNTDACNGSPARMSSSSHVITVGGTDSADDRYYVNSGDASNYGNCVTLWAPGEDVLMLDVRPSTPTSLVESGTSFSAGYTSGAAALYLQSSPLATPWRVKTDLRDNGVPVEIDSYHSGLESLLMAKPANACFEWTCNSSTLTCDFDASCSTASRNSLSYEWDFGDGTVLTTSSPTISHTYGSSNIFSVDLTVKAPYAYNDTDSGCVNTTGAGLLGCMPTDATD